jgi:hypothetical protein
MAKLGLISYSGFLLNDPTNGGINKNTQSHIFNKVSKEYSVPNILKYLQEKIKNNSALYEGFQDWIFDNPPKNLSFKKGDLPEKYVSPLKNEDEKSFKQKQYEASLYWNKKQKKWGTFEIKDEHLIHFLTSIGCIEPINL